MQMAAAFADGVIDSITRLGTPQRASASARPSPTGPPPTMATRWRCNSRVPLSAGSRAGWRVNSKPPMDDMADVPVP
jgi:hypothetical protein